MPRTRHRLALLATIGAGLVLAACGSSSSPSSSASSAAAATAAVTTTPAAATTTASAGVTAAGISAAGISAAGISAERCAENKKAGKITYLSGFDFAATASIVEVVVAKEKGYFDKVCLDVDVKASFSTANYPLVGANTAQFASAGSYAEMLGFAKDGAQLVAVAVDGKVGIDALLVRAEGPVKTPADLKGKTIGVKGALPPAEVALLNKYGLKQGTDYKEVSLEGFDPKQHWALPIDALPVYKSNEPGQLDAAGIKYTMFDPATEGIPGNFGVIYSNAKFVKEHPTAVQDFLRAAMKGMEDAQADPGAAVKIAFARITAGGNKNFLSEAGESYRWGVESKIVKDNTPAGEGIGLVHAADLAKLVDAYTTAGVFKTKPSTDGTFDEALIAGVYDRAGRVVWPA
jgi:ABC-type nitrate/sulfonate/bicarbonate transport system substrate-binding protein